MNSFHLIGIKGTGMSALAAILKDMNYEVSGSDVEEDFFTNKKLAQKGIIPKKFCIDNITKNNIYIASSCYNKENNIEVRKVIEEGYIFYYYHEFIEYFFKNKIGISGTHGKTTTTSILAHLFKDNNIAYLIGEGTGSASSDYSKFIFEACEYNNHFLIYNYDYLIINNIDFDHPDFFKDITDVINSFQKAAIKSEVLIINNDDENCRLIKHQKKFTFGINTKADISCEVLDKLNNGYKIKVIINENEYVYFLPFTGIYMVYNFLAALSVYYLNGNNLNKIQDLLLSFKKPSRRMEIYPFYDNIIIDDYAHHPREIKLLLDAIKQKYPNKEIIIVFQPHTYSRTLSLKSEFREVFKDYQLYLAKTFTSKREGYNKILENEVRTVFENSKRFQKKDLKEFKKQKNKVILFLGAGNISNYITYFQ